VMSSFTFYDWLLAFLPILTILILMLCFRWGGAEAGAVGWVMAVLIAACRFGAGWQLLMYAQLKGLLLTIYVLYITWAALLFYRVTDEAGAVKTIGTILTRLTPDRGLQVLLLGWAFSSFLQGVGGFGVPVAVIAPLLMSMGFPPLAAVVIPSVGHAWAVTFGSLGTSFYALIAATGRSGAELAPWSAALLGLACFACGAGTLWAAGGWPTLKVGLLPLSLIWLAMSTAQFLTVTHGLWSIGAMVGGLTGLAVGIAWARHRHKHDRGDQGSRQDSHMPSAHALLPYALVVIVVLVAELVRPVHEFLGQVVIQVEFPELATARGWVTPAGPGRTISIFGHAGALLVYASLITCGVFWRQKHYRPGAARRIVRSVVEKATRSSLGVAAMVGMAVTMEHAGMTHLLAEGLVRLAGSVFPLISPFIGAIGAFMTGSNTNSNVVFGSLQQQVAVLLGISPQIILAAQTAGGAIGSLFAPAKVIVGCSTVGLGGREGPAVEATLRYGLVIVAGVSLATGALIYLR